MFHHFRDAERAHPCQRHRRERCNALKERVNVGRFDMYACGSHAISDQIVDGGSDIPAAHLAGNVADGAPDGGAARDQRIIVDDSE